MRCALVLHEAGDLIEILDGFDFSFSTNTVPPLKIAVNSSSKNLPTDAARIAVRGRLKCFADSTMGKPHVSAMEKER
jgi:hypothetical protein